MINVDDRVHLTTKYLQSTGQYAGRECHSVWTVTGLTNNGRWAITDELIDTSCTVYTTQELLDDPTLQYRRIAVANLQVCK